MTLFDKFLSASADLALEALLSAAGLASAGGMHQPEEPKNLHEVADKRKMASKRSK